MTAQTRVHPKPRALGRAESLPPHNWRLQRKCACGGTPGPTGECKECKRKRLGLQTKLAINPPGDRYEEEADRVAEAVVGGATAQPPSISSLGRDGAVQPGSAAKRDVFSAPPIVDEVLLSSGEPLGGATRTFMEERFGYDFARVRVHRDARAAESARSVNAHAYTVGHDVIFDPGAFAPDTNAGRRLLAHELTHVMQQQTTMPRLQRKLVVDPNHPAAAPISAPATDPAASLSPATRFAMMDSLIQGLCDEFEVDTTGEVLSKARVSFDPAVLAAGNKPVGCCCLNVLTNAADTWTIEVSQVIGPHTRSNTRQVVLSPTNTPVEFGSFTAASTLAFQGAVPAAGHELCGHAALQEIGAHPPAGQDRTTTDVHDPTVRVENLVSTEQGVPPTDLRGLAASGPHRGESVDHITIRNYPLNATDVPAGEQSQIDFAAAYIVANEEFVDVLGHSDSAGSATAKQQTSSARATKAKQALVKAGVPEKITKFSLVDANRFTRVEGLSDTQPPPPPLDANQDNWRRVDILMAGFPAGAQKPPSGTPTTVTPHTQSPNVPALKASQDPCVSLLVGGAYP